MQNELQHILDTYSDLQAEVEALRLKLLEKSVELDGLQNVKAENGRLASAASRVVALDNANSRLRYDAEEKAGIIAQLQHNLTVAEKKLKDLNKENPTKLKEHNKRLQIKNREQQKGLDKYKSEISEYRKDISAIRSDYKDLVRKYAQQSITYTGGTKGHELWLIPDVLTVDREGRGAEKILALWYTSPEGIGYMLTILGGRLCYPKEVRDGNLPLPPDFLQEKAQRWLSKLERQRYIITDADLEMFGKWVKPDDDFEPLEVGELNHWTATEHVA